MARVKLSEYKAKQLLLGRTYKGVQLRSGALTVPKGAWVAKVDQGIKKRMKQGLVAVNKPAAELVQAMRGWEKKGFSQFLLEPFVPHETAEEQYLSLERVREGVRILHAAEGGIDIESNASSVLPYMVVNESDVARVAKASGLPKTFLADTIRVFEENFFAFLEINPLVIKGGVPHLLDAAALVDSAAAFFVRGAWSEADVVKSQAKYASEARIEALDATTPASLKLTVTDQNGALFFLLSGGGGSIVIADEVQIKGAGEFLANYGEYSGGPTREETYLYAKEIIDLCIASGAKKKALVIAGGIANFTDVRTTFLGIIDALQERAAEMRRKKIRVFVRRGGPREAEGLALMRAFLDAEGLLGFVHGSDTTITSAVEEAVRYIGL